jgi:septal ring factor EnvC (AmiA/AmiB activator)
MTADISPEALAALVERLKTPPFGTEMSELALGAEAAEMILALQSRLTAAEAEVEANREAADGHYQQAMDNGQALSRARAEVERLMKERDAFVSGQNTKIAALEADAKAARDAAAGSFARAERAEAALTEANAHAEMLAIFIREAAGTSEPDDDPECDCWYCRAVPLLAAHAARNGE